MGNSAFSTDGAGYLGVEPARLYRKPKRGRRATVLLLFYVSPLDLRRRTRGRDLFRPSDGRRANHATVVVVLVPAAAASPSN